MADIVWEAKHNLANWHLARCLYGLRQVPLLMVLDPCCLSNSELYVGLKPSDLIGSVAGLIVHPSSLHCQCMLMLHAVRHKRGSPIARG